MSVKHAFERFMAEGFRSMEGDRVVELLDSGNYKILPDFDNSYESAGLMLPVAQGSTERSLRDDFAQHWQANQNAQAAIANRGVGDE